MGPDLQSKDPRHHANPVFSKRRKWFIQENKIAMEGYVLREPKVKGYRKCMLSLQLNKVMFLVSEQRLVDQANTIRRNSWMTELEIEELETNLAENDSYKEEERKAGNIVSNLGEEVRNILTALEADEEIGSLEEEKEIAIIEVIGEVLETRQKDKLPVLRDIPKRSQQKKLLRLIKFQVNLKYTALQNLMNYFMQESLLLQIGWD